MQKIVFEIDEYTIHLYFSDNDTNRILHEAKYRGSPLIGQYSVRKDHPHSVVGQYHLHVFYRSNQLFAINKDGSAHDQSHGVRIPNKVAQAIKDKFVDFQIPRTNIIESAPDEIQWTIFRIFD